MMIHLLSIDCWGNPLPNSWWVCYQAMEPWEFKPQWGPEKLCWSRMIYWICLIYNYSPITAVCQDWYFPLPCVIAGGYTLSFYRGSQDGKTIRFTWKSYRSHSWGKRETGLPDQKMNVNHLHGSSLKEHVQHGSWKTETKNAYVEVTWRSKYQVGNFYVNMFSPHVEYILLGWSLKPSDWPPHHVFSSLHLSSHPRHAGHPYLKSNHQRVQVWIQHQKFTNRAFYIKSLIKKKTYEKPGVGFMSFPSFWEMKSSWEVWGTLVQNQRFYHE